jgi:hypothetical protein
MKGLIVFLVIAALLFIGCSDKLKLEECTKLDASQKNACVSIKASEAISIEKYSDGKVCELFLDDSLSSNCFVNFGIKWKNEALCGKARDDDKNFCKAAVRGNTDFCKNISSAKKREDCFVMLESEQQKNFDYAKNPVFQEYRTELGKLQIYSGPVVEGENTYYYMVDYDARGKHYHEYMDQLILDALYWMTNNTEKQDKILAWWDYGHAIEGITGREAVFYAPSEKIFEEIYEKEGKTASYFSQQDNYADGKELEEFSKALLSYKDEELNDYMNERTLSYILITAFEADKLKEIATAAGMDAKTISEKMALFNLLSGKGLNHFNVVYEDDFVKIYKRIS